MLKNRKARGNPALETVSIFLARSMNSFLISSWDLDPGPVPPPPPVAVGPAPVAVGPAGVAALLEVVLAIAPSLPGVAMAVKLNRLSRTSSSWTGNTQVRGHVIRSVPPLLSSLPLPTSPLQPSLSQLGEFQRGQDDLATVKHTSLPSSPPVPFQPECFCLQPEFIIFCICMCDDFERIGTHRFWD